MRKICVVFGIVLALGISTTAMAELPAELPPFNVYMALADGTIYDDVNSPYQATAGEVIEIAMFVEGAEHLTGFDAFITGDIGITPRCSNGSSRKAKNPCGRRSA